MEIATTTTWISLLMRPPPGRSLRVIELSVLDAAATRLKCHKTTINQLLPYDEAIMQNYGLVSVAIINHFLPRQSEASAALDLSRCVSRAAQSRPSRVVL